MTEHRPMKQNLPPLWLTLPFMFILIILLLYPFRFVFEFDIDEGNELIISLLHFLDFDQVPSDHPPAYYLLLSSLFRVLGPGVLLSRLVTLSFSALGLASSIYVLNKHWGKPHAFAGFLFILLLPYYFQLSVSVMIGLPSIALGLLSLAALMTWHQEKKDRWLLISGAVIAASIMIKLFTSLLIPIMIAGIMFEAYSATQNKIAWKSILRSLFLWGLPFIGVLSYFGLFVIGLDNLDQLIFTHINAQQLETYLKRAEIRNINSYLEPSRGIIILGILGSIISMARRKWLALYFMAWMTLAYISLSLLIPVWYHHQVLTTIPAAILAGIGWGESFKNIRRVKTPGNLPIAQTAGSIFIVILSILIFISRGKATAKSLDFGLPNFQRSELLDSEEFTVYAIMSDYASQTKEVVTDRPMFAFRLNKPVPPEVAVFSEKRLLSGEITEAQLIEIIKGRSPAQVLIGRFDHLTKTIYYLEQEYNRVYISQDYQLFIRPNLLTPVSE